MHFIDIILEIPDFASLSSVSKLLDNLSGFSIISEIKLGKSFDKPPRLIKKIQAPKKIDEIKLTPAEISTGEKKVAAVPEDRKKFLLETILSYQKAEKRKIQGGWHKCKCCNLLCPPNEILCNICLVKEREKLKGAIRKIFIDAPETPFREIQQQIIQEFPHLQKECTLEKIESARMDLILQRAQKISYGDTNSDAAIFLVRLIRQLPAEKLTDEIIKRTLKEFKFNLADLPPLPKYEFSKLEKRAIKKVPLQKM